MGRGRRGRERGGRNTVRGCKHRDEAKYGECTMKAVGKRKKRVGVAPCCGD
jgi:hypothetical protein